MTVDDTTPSEREVAVAYLDAIRLGMEASDNPQSFIRLVDNILERAPKGYGTDTLPTKYLIDAIHATEAQIVVA